ncbi:MAG: UvrB/UvrC motif-containing protein, partial [Gaiellaceae bacterium]
TESLRYEEAARLRDRIEALEQLLDRLRRLERLRTLDACLIASAVAPGWRKAFFVRAGVICTTRSLPPGRAARLEIGAGLAIAQGVQRKREPLTSGQAEDMLLLDSFVRRPPPEVTVLPLDADELVNHTIPA